MKIKYLCSQDQIEYPLQADVHEHKGKLLKVWNRFL